MTATKPVSRPVPHAQPGGSVPEVQSTPLHCRNCGSSLSGEFCSNCGQRERGVELHLGDALSGAFNDAFTWDSRLWRTLVALVLKPGYLSAEFFAGRRARYVAPFRLYLIISFLMFFIISLPGLRDMAMSDKAIEPPSAQEEENDLELDLSLGDEDMPPWLRGLAERIETGAQRVQQDPGRFMNAMASHLPKMMFLMLPLFALLLRLFYLLTPFHYLQHLVFAAHYHCFVYLLFLLNVIAEAMGAAGGVLPVLASAVYLPLAMRRCYGSSRGIAILGAMLIGGSYAAALLFAFATTSLIAVLLV